MSTLIMIIETKEATDRRLNENRTKLYGNGCDIQDVSLLYTGMVETTGFDFPIRDL